MNRLFLVAFAGWLSIEALAQGTINLNNRLTGIVDAPISLMNGQGIGTAPEGATAQLFLVSTNGGALTPLFPTTTFRTTSAAASFYVNAVEVSVPNMPAGSTAVVIMRAWVNGYDYPGFRWESQPLTVTLGGQTVEGETLPAAPLTGLTFYMPLTPTFAQFRSISRADDQLRMEFSFSVAFAHTFHLESSADLKNWEQVEATWELPVSQSVRVYKVTVPFSASNSTPLLYRVRMDPDSR